MIKVLGYFTHKEDKEINSYTAMVFIDSGLRGNKVECYCPQEGHSEVDRAYINECTPISKAEYLEASKLFYTPAEYLQEEEEEEEEEEHTNDNMSSRERAMREAGHRETDFI